MSTNSLPIAIYHEHPDWFRPLFAELDRRGQARCQRLEANSLLFQKRGMA